MRPVLFLDLDGTLTDISGRHFGVYRQAVERFNGRPIEKDLYWNLKQSDTKWPDILEMSHVEDSKYGAFMDYFISRIESIDELEKDPLLSGAKAILDELSQKYRVVLVSLRRDKEGLLKQLTSLGIISNFEDILSGHSETKEGTKSKKSELIREWGEYQDSTIIGDTEADIASAHDLGIRSIAVTTGIRNRAFLETYQPTYIVSSLQEAVEKL